MSTGVGTLKRRVDRISRPNHSDLHIEESIGSGLTSFSCHPARVHRCCPSIVSRDRRPSNGTHTNIPIDGIERVSHLPRPARRKAEAAEFVGACARGLYRSRHGDARQARRLHTPATFLGRCVAESYLDGTVNLAGLAALARTDRGE